MKNLAIIAFALFVASLSCLIIKEYYCVNKTTPWHSYSKEVLNMANTVSPIITMLSQQLGDYENIQISIGESSAIGGKLIYKREETEWIKGSNCVGGYGNVYYIRIYEWDREGDRLWYKPIKDIPIGARSCIPEKDVSKFHIGIKNFNMLN